MSAEKSPAGVATAGPGGVQDAPKSITQRPGGEGTQLQLFASCAPPAIRPVDADLDPPSNTTPTSREAARRIKKRSPLQRQRVSRCILDAGSHGRTDEETGTELGMLLHSVSPRRGELVKLGLVRDSGRRRPTSSGRPAIVWVATAAGAAAGNGRG